MEPYDNPTNSGDDVVVRRRHGPFTPLQLLMSLVLIGVLSSIAVVSLDRFVATGRKSACDVSADASRTAVHVYLASNANTYPINFTELTTERAAVTTGTRTAAIPAALLLPANVAINVVATVPPAPAAQAYMQLSSGSSWYLTMALVSGGAPTFTCSP